MTQSLDQLCLPPHNLEVERAILGTVLLHPPVLETVGELIRETDFYDSRHQAIFAAMCHLDQVDRPIDHITVCEALKAANKLQHVGGSGVVAELIAEVSSAANIHTHCRIVREKAQRRILRKIAYDLSAHASDEQEPLALLIERAEQAILSLEADQREAEPKCMADNVSERLHHLEEIFKKNIPAGLSTGFASLDHITAGFKPGNLSVLAARPGMGKTGLALSVALYIILNLRLPVHLFSLEMTRGELTDRLLSMIALVDLRAMQTGSLKDDEWWKLADAAQQLETAPLYLDDRGTVTLPQLRRRARRAKAKHGMALLIVDYLQLIAPTGKSESRQQDVSEISRGLKLLSKELSVPVLALAQLNRKADDRSDQRPLLSDLRDSGAIEQDADLVMFIYRDEVYHKDTEDRGIAEILIRKQRNGPIGERRLLFLERYAKFCELDGAV
jgi:replicative DNA helicase